MKTSKFTEPDCWKKARELVNEVYKLSRKNSFKSDFGLIDQIRRSSVSSMANIAEGFGSRTNTEFIRFLNIGIRSLYETQSHLFVAIDQKYIDNDEFNVSNKLADDCINLCKGFVRYLSNSRKP